MFEINLLVLTSVTLLIIAVVALFYSVLLKSKELNRVKQILHGTIKKIVLPNHVCLHQLGHLNSLPKNKPIPPECMGCPDIFECLAQKQK